MMFVRAFLLLTALSLPVSAQTAEPLRVAIAGLVHGHVDGFLRPLPARKDFQLVGIYEPDSVLRQKYAERFHLPAALFFTDLKGMLETTRAQAVATFTDTYDHPMVVETAAALHLPVMMEKPMAVSNEHARRIQAAATRAGIPIVVNYETTWYPTHAAIHALTQSQQLGQIRKMVAMDGHQGPKEIGVGPEFLHFLNDPQRNGAGALFDFGCYGANLMTWLMENRRPTSITAVTRRFKPSIYPNVDDDATILVEYPEAEGIIEGSWNWPFSRKDLEVYGATGYAVATGGNNLRARLPGQKAEETSTPGPLPPEDRDSLSYLASVVRGRKPSGLSSLENNMIVVEILDAARESARSGKKIVLH